ncbi:MAG: isoprenylcysteine carboxylmethyltransferase family protein [Candidatus Thorarchaeota archaeon]
MMEMDLFPVLELGWLNGWILLVILYGTFGILLLVFPKPVVARLYAYDRLRWSKKQRAYHKVGKLLILVNLILIILTPLSVGSTVFVLGVILFVVGLTGFVIALFNFKNTPLNQPITKGLYSKSRHPQMFMLSVAGVGMCLAIGSWIALIILAISALFGRSRTLAEESALLEQYGDSYRDYMERVPRYLLIKTRVGENEKEQNGLRM